MRSKQLRAANPNTVFAAAGDLIGASTFESFIQKDKPTIDALNEAGLEVSAVGNHEFDQGYDDLVDRVMAPYDATTNPQGGAEWEYIGANVAEGTDGPDDLAPSWIETSQRRRGRLRRCGHRGPARRWSRPTASPSIEVTDIVDAVNDEADDLKADGADIIVLLVHEGAAGDRLRDDGRRPDDPVRRDHHTASTTTSTRSSPATPTWSTTAPSRWRAGPVAR